MKHLAQHLARDRVSHGLLAARLRLGGNDGGLVGDRPDVDGAQQVGADVVGAARASRYAAVEALGAPLRAAGSHLGGGSAAPQGGVGFVEAMPHVLVGGHAAARLSAAGDQQRQQNQHQAHQFSRCRAAGCIRPRPPRPGSRALAHSGTLSPFHALQPTAAALTVPSAGIRCPDPGTAVRPAQDADLPAEHHVVHWGGASGPARVGWGAHRAWRAQGLLERARRATAAVELAVDRLGRWEGLGGGWAGLGRW